MALFNHTALLKQKKLSGDMPEKCLQGESMLLEKC